MTDNAADAGASIAALYRYPVKGLSPEPLDSICVLQGETLPHDRIYAIEAGSHEFDPEQPKFMPKTKFLMLARDEKLATLQTRFDPDTSVLTILREGKQVARGDLSQRIGRQLIEQFMSAFMGKDLTGNPRIVHAQGHSFSDAPAKFVSIINLASLRDLERVLGAPVDPLRFRANVYVDGLAPWAEFDWLDKRLLLGGAQVQIVQRIKRCAATNVDPSTGVRDMQVPRTLADSFGHVDCGLYARVEQGGNIARGDRIIVAV